MPRKAKLTRVFSIDIRALAFFRMFIATILLFDFSRLCSYSTYFFSDQGVLPRADALKLMAPGMWSINLLNGSSTFQLALFIIGIFFSVLLLFGCRTKLSLFIVFIIHLSVNSRNMLIIQGGDTLLNCLMFWSLWLPLNHSYSIDSALSKGILNKEYTNTNLIFSVATVAILLQAAYVWFISGLIKLPGFYWHSGEAITRILRAEWISSPLGTYLRNFPSIWKSLTFYVLYLEVIGPILLFMPYRFIFFRS